MKQNKYYIYKYYIENSLMYIGKTKRLYKRFLEHLKENKKYSQITHIEYAELLDKLNMDIAELITINQQYPLWNKHISKGSIPKLNLEFTRLTVKEFILKFSPNQNTLYKYYDVMIKEKNKNINKLFKHKINIRPNIYNNINNNKVILHNLKDTLYELSRCNDDTYTKTSFGTLKLSSNLYPDEVNTLLHCIDNNIPIPIDIMERDLFEVDIVKILEEEKYKIYIEIIPYIVYIDNILYINKPLIEKGEL